MIELLTTAEMSQADRLAIKAGTTSIALMENAGAAVADAASARLDPSRSVAVVVGPGNNGGDGLIAARILRQRGHDVGVISLAGRDRLKGDAAEAARRYGEALHSPDTNFSDSAIIIDGLFGAGLDRPVEGAAANLIARINRSGAPVISVDLPSGINGDTGAVMGCAVQAKATVTFFRRKPAHLLLPGRAYCGTVSVAEIGIPDSVLAAITPRTSSNEPALWRHHFPVLRADGHKYNRGHTVVVSGPLWSTGAARLAARGALRAGSGLVTIASPVDALPVHAASNEAIMVRGADGVDGLAALLADARINTVVIGPGGGVGAEMRAKVELVLRSDGSVILDADALTSFEDCPDELLTSLRQRADARTILTPHGGEFARMFRTLPWVSKVHEKLEVARLASHETGGVMVLKGGDTLVSGTSGEVCIAGNAPPYLATAGSGDVLAGIIAGLSAQGMPPFEAASAGVWMHGEAAREFGPGLISEDLPELLPRVLGKLSAFLNSADGC